MKPAFVHVLAVTAIILAGCGSLSESWAQTRIPRVGIITVGAAGDEAFARLRFELIRTAFAKQGLIEGRTVAFEIRDARGDASRFAEIAAELVRLKVDLIWADSAPALHAAYAATRTIPIVAFDFTTDPVADGYAQSYGRPGGNVTGVFLDAPELSGKWLELLKATVPGLSSVAVLWDPRAGDSHARGIQAIAGSFGVQLQIIEVRTPEQIDGVASAFQTRPQALILLPSPMTFAESPRLVRLATKQRLPATSIFRQFTEDGGLLSYGPEQGSILERGAVQVTRILRGAKPGDLPIERPSKFELAVNLKAAKALKLTIPASVLARADRVIR